VTSSSCNKLIKKKKRMRQCSLQKHLHNQLACKKPDTPLLVRMRMRLTTSYDAGVDEPKASQKTELTSSSESEGKPYPSLLYCPSCSCPPGNTKFPNPSGMSSSTRSFTLQSILRAVLSNVTFLYQGGGERILRTPGTWSGASTRRDGHLYLMQPAQTF
jgi:hypothetical protein